MCTRHPPCQQVNPLIDARADGVFCAGALLPREVASGSMNADGVDEACDVKRNAGGRLVLVVEDDADIRVALRELLELEGFRTDEASDGVQALARLERDPPVDLILLDLMMPGMDGWEFRARQLGDPRFARIPVVVVSGAGAMADDLSELRVAAFLRKPVDPEELAEVVHAQCALADLPRA